MKAYDVFKIVQLTVLMFGPMIASTSVHAEDSEASEEHVLVTGSRIRSSVDDSAQPITVLQADALKREGVFDITRALRETTFNSVGSYRDQSGTNLGQVSLIDLKGLGADRTLVLINGKRVGGNPLTGISAVDLNTIPMSAVDRIEILSDSASAVYGADAIGGVVNIVTKQSFSGAELSLGHDNPSRDDATTDRFDLTFGQSSDSGNVMVSLDYYKRRPIFDADRSYSRSETFAAPGELPIHFVETQSIFEDGNTGFRVNEFGDYEGFIVGDCDPSVYYPIAYPLGQLGEGCGYGFANDSMLTGAVERTGLFVSADYNISDSHKLYSENRASLSNTAGRYAPYADYFYIFADNPLNTTGEDFELLHRFLGHGNRDDKFNIREMDNVIGISGSVYSDKLHYDIYARSYRYEAEEKGSGYLIGPIINSLIESGAYDFVDPFNPNNAGAIQQSLANTHRDLSSELQNLGLVLDGAINSSMSWAAGLEYFNETYRDQYDSLREAGNVLGAPASSAHGKREHWAVFSEFAIDVFNQLNVKIAGRYDRYSDFGNEFSPQIAARWEPIDFMAIRASWGQGFKAPNLGNLGLAVTGSNYLFYDEIGCTNDPDSDNCFFGTDATEVASGNQELRAETSTSMNLGYVITPNDTLSLSMDYWRVDIEDAIYLLSIDDILSLELNNTLPEEITVNREDAGAGLPGHIVSCAGVADLEGCGIRKTFANLSQFDAEGLDVNVSLWQSLSFGEVSAQALWSHYIGYDEKPLEDGPVFNRPTTAGWPKNRFKGNLGWSNNGINVEYTYHWIDNHEGGPSGEAFNIYVQHDIHAVWEVAAGVDLAFGIRNVTDEDPSVSTVSGWDITTSPISTNLYDVAGRAYSATVTWRNVD